MQGDPAGELGQIPSLVHTKIECLFDVCQIC